MTITPPENVQYATLTHRLLRTYVDTADPDRFPDIKAATDATVTVTPKVASYKNLALPATFIQTVHKGHYDNNGFLRDEQDNLGIVVMAPDNPDLSPRDWQYTVQISAAGVTFPSFPITVSAGGTYDLTTLSPAIPATPVVTIVSEETRVRSEQAADRAEAAAASIDTDIGAAVEAYLAENPPSGDGGDASDTSVSLLIQDTNSATRGALNTFIGSFNYVTTAAFNSALIGKADTVHNHIVGQVTGLQALLDAKSAIGHGHVVADISNFTASVDARVQAIVGAAPAALDTLDELAAALGDDANFSGTVTTALANRVRVDASQALTATQQSQARTNIDAAQTAHSHSGADVTAASETSRGTVELASVTESATGTATNLAVTPAGLKGVADTKANSTTVTALDTRLTAQETFPRIYVVDAIPTTPPAGSRTDDVFIVRGSGTVPPPASTLRQLLGTGVADETVLTQLSSATVGSSDNPVDAVSGTVLWQVNASGVRRLHITNSASAVTYRWSTNFPATSIISFDLGYEPVANPTASNTFFQATGWCRLSASTSNTITVLNNAGTAALSSVGGTAGAASPALTLGAGIYRIKGWRANTTTGTLSQFKIYNPDGTLLWGPVNRDCGIDPATAIIFGRTGTAGGEYLLSYHRIDDVDSELAS